MQKYYYDLHLHSCLSPCGDMDMTPNNIVNMAKLLGMDVIALTDHNTSLNCEAAIKVGEEVGLLVIPGMELTTAEDIHAVCLFPTLEKALNFSQYVDENRIHVKNKAEIYGRQVIMNENDEEIDEIEDLLLPASFIGMYDAYRKAHEFGGICYPAHIDREANGIVATLGTFPEDPPYTAFELACGDALESYRERFPILDRLSYVVSSDAHQLWNLSDGSNALTLNAPADDPQAVRRALIAYLKTNRR